eukprot:COSAG06_NODE_21150_length_767_cov_6.482036_1_plen_115_part_10
MQITEEDDSESRGRLAPHEVPLAMAATMVACRRLHAARGALASVRVEGGDVGEHHAMLSLNSVLLSATHPPFCSVSRCLSGVSEAETRGAPLPLTAAAASLLPASRRVPGPVAGL